MCKKQNPKLEKSISTASIKTSEVNNDDQDNLDNSLTPIENPLNPAEEKGMEGKQVEKKANKKRVSLATKEDLQNPDIAWPTVLLTFGSLAVFSVPWIFALEPEKISAWWIIPQTLALYASFTPMHDAVHGAISRKYKWVNELCGYISSFMQLYAYKGFKYIHLKHHKYTNDPEKDPDYFSSHFHDYSVLLLPLQWMIQPERHIITYMKDIYGRGKRWPYIWITRHLADATEVAITMPPFWYYTYYYLGLSGNGYGWQFLYYWFIPLKLASCFLAFSFDYAPHRYHEITREEDIYKSTHRITGMFGTQNGWDLTILMLYQNYHICHHLYPSIPFYRYNVTWDRDPEKLRELGVVEAPLFPVELPWMKAVKGIVDNSYKKDAVPNHPRPVISVKKAQ